MRFVSAIPLPLRIVGTLLLGILVMSLFRTAASSLFVVLAVLLWVLTLVVLFYEFGWLNVLSRVPLLSSFLGFLSNRRVVTDPDSVVTSDAPRGALDDDERAAMYESAKLELESLDGIPEAKYDIENKLIVPATLNPENPFNTQSSALVAIFHGPRGNGKTTAAHCTSRMLVGTHALKIAKVVTLRSSDLRGGTYGTPTQLGLAKAEEAVDGMLLIDDADWLLAESEYGNGTSPGVDLGLALLDVTQQYPRQIFIALTMSTEGAERLKQHEGHARWLGKLTVRDVRFDNLEVDALLSVLTKQLGAMEWRFEDMSASNAATRLLEDMQRMREAHFDNAEACRRVAERLVEIASEENEDNSAERTINRRVVQILDDQLE